MVRRQMGTVWYVRRDRRANHNTRYRHRSARRHNIWYPCTISDRAQLSVDKAKSAVPNASAGYGSSERRYRAACSKAAGAGYHEGGQKDNRHIRRPNDRETQGAQRVGREHAANADASHRGNQPGDSAYIGKAASTGHRESRQEDAGRPQNKRKYGR